MDSDLPSGLRTSKSTLKGGSWIISNKKYWICLVVRKTCFPWWVRKLNYYLIRFKDVHLQPTLPPVFLLRKRLLQLRVTFPGLTCAMWASLRAWSSPMSNCSLKDHLRNLSPSGPSWGWGDKWTESEASNLWLRDFYLHFSVCVFRKRGNTSADEATAGEKKSGWLRNWISNLVHR